RTAGRPLRFVGCCRRRQTRASEARDARELMHRLAEVPADSVFFHTFGYFLRARPFTTAYGNDFARWAAVEIGDRTLAERLAVVDPFAFATVEALREHLVTILQDHLRLHGGDPRVEFDRAFHFQRSHIVEVGLGLAATTLAEFRAGLASADASASYLHTVEARARGGRRAGARPRTSAQQPRSAATWVSTRAGRSRGAIPPTMRPPARFRRRSRARSACSATKVSPAGSR